MKKQLLILIIPFLVKGQNLPISGLPAASALTGTEVTIVVQGGVTKKMPVSVFSGSCSSTTGSGPCVKATGPSLTSPVMSGATIITSTLSAPKIVDPVMLSTGDVPVLGYVWTRTATSGAGTWSTVAGGGGISPFTNNRSFFIDTTIFSNGGPYIQIGKASSEADISFGPASTFGDIDGTNNDLQIFHPSQIRFTDNFSWDISMSSTGLFIGAWNATAPANNAAAKLDIAASSGVANTGQIRLRSGTALTATVAGMCEYAGNKWFFTNSTGRYSPVYTPSATPLTSGRVPFSTTNGVLKDDANFAYASIGGAPNLFLQNGSSTANINIQGAGGSLLTLGTNGDFLGTDQGQGFQITASSAIRLSATGASTNVTISNTGVICTGSISATNILPGSETIYAGTVSQTGTATTAFVVTIGTTMSNTNYKVNLTAKNALSAAAYYTTNTSTTQFTVTYLAGLTGTVTFDWILAP